MTHITGLVLNFSKLSKWQQHALCWSKYSYKIFPFKKAQIKQIRNILPLKISPIIKRNQYNLNFFGLVNTQANEERKNNQNKIRETKEIKSFAAFLQLPKEKPANLNMLCHLTPTATHPLSTRSTFYQPGRTNTQKRGHKLSFHSPFISTNYPQCTSHPSSILMNIALFQSSVSLLNCQLEQLHNLIVKDWSMKCEERSSC